MNTPNIQRIDITPSWTEIYPALLRVYGDTSPSGRRAIESEFANMARLADQRVSDIKNRDAEERARREAVQRRAERNGQ